MSETISNVDHVENFNPAMMDENRFSIIVDLADTEDAASAYYERYEASIPEERVDYYGNAPEPTEEEMEMYKQASLLSLGVEKVNLYKQLEAKNE